MGKAAVPGNYAVSGIQGTSTTKPTTSLTGGTTTSGSSSGSGATGSSSSSTKTSSSTRSSGSSTGTGTGSSGTGTTEVVTPSYEEKFYAALANGIGAGSGDTESDATANAQAAVQQAVRNAQTYSATGNVAPINYVDIEPQRSQMKTAEAQEKAQAASSIDYATAQAINELARNLEDSRATYQTQRNQVDADEAKALDNQVLYAEARGDRGGIGQAQYGAIQNTVANNRLAVNSAEAQLQTDTARQIADLQAQGEYEKADKLTEISNSYLKELTELEQWAKEQNIGVEEFNAKLSEWQNEYRMDVAQYLTDTELEAADLYGVGSNGATTADYRTDTNKRLADAGKAMMNAGIVPSSEQLAAMGYTPEQYWIQQMANAASYGY